MNLNKDYEGASMKVPLSECIDECIEVALTLLSEEEEPLASNWPYSLLPPNKPNTEGNNNDYR